ncbi:interferon alpha/beta receptor 2-like [Aulostomus maculatus]
MRWLMFLLQSCHVVGVLLPAPSNVSISSFNMEHMLSFLPGPQTPSDSHFSVQIIHLRRKNTWRQVAGCLQLTAGQMCNLTRAFKDQFGPYRARVRTFTATQTSNWTTSRQFQPFSDTVLGPLDVSVSGCGNCLHLQVSVPTTRSPQQHQQLENLYMSLHLLVRRVRDGSQFELKLPYKEESVITYLQPGVEYCVTVSVTSYINPNFLPSRPSCAFTSPPPTRSSWQLVWGLLGAFGILMGFICCGGQLSHKLLRQGSASEVRNPASCARPGRKLSVRTEGSAGWPAPSLRTRGLTASSQGDIFNQREDTAAPAVLSSF